MTIELQGHIKSIETSTLGRVRTRIQLEMERGNGQFIEIQMTQEEAKAYMPGTGITLRFWPNGSTTQGESDAR